MRETIFIIDPAPEERRRLAAALAGEPASVLACDSAEQFLERLDAVPSGCVLAPADLPGIGVLALIDRIRRRHLALAVVVIGRTLDVGTAVQVVRAGAAEFLEHPVSDHRLRSVVRRILGTDDA